MADVSNPDLKAAYEEVRKDNNSVDWCVFGYGEGATIELLGKGEGGVDELKAKLSDDIVAYGYVRFKTGDTQSTRAKFVLITWVGSGVSVLRKAKVSVHKADIKSVLKEFAVEVQADDMSDLDTEVIGKMITKAMGADYSNENKLK
eukprot:TRINITY_DN18139_c0_g1_i1.p1 TRINITY_DN18139_c0_g1~~TRINITY_DN18139_c0_g1_i1.p1  ORF type:complete len:146 (+),score=40.92 TRINITY_DN18139_c0_g1_i1:3-440(+)